MKQPATKRVLVRLPQSMIREVKRIAKLAGVTPTQAYNVLLAVYVTQGGKSHE